MLLLVPTVATDLSFKMTAKKDGNKIFELFCKELSVPGIEPTTTWLKGQRLDLSTDVAMTFPRLLLHLYEAFPVYCHQTKHETTNHFHFRNGMT